MGNTSLHSRHQRMKIPVAPVFAISGYSLNCSNFSHPSGYVVVSCCGFNVHFPDDFSYAFCFWDILLCEILSCINILAVFLLGHLISICRNFFLILGVSSLTVTCIASIFFQAVACLFILLMFSWQKFLILSPVYQFFLLWLLLSITCLKHLTFPEVMKIIS